MTSKLYEARQAGERDRIRAAVSSEFTSSEERDRIVSEIIGRDASCGAQQSRRRYVTATSLESDIPEDWYSVRIGYKIHYETGDTWEEVYCHVDGKGTEASVVGIKFGPNPARE